MSRPPTAPAVLPEEMRVLDFACPYCRAQIGAPCRTPRGRPRALAHAPRWDRFAAAQRAAAKAWSNYRDHQLGRN